MAVAVEPGINTRGVGNDVAVHPGRALGFIAQVSQNDNIVCAFSAGVIDRLLHGGVKGFAGVVLQETIDEFALVIHKVTGRGGTQGHGSTYAHERDFHTVEFLDDVGLEDRFAFLVEVAAEVGEISLFRQLQEAVHAVIELMVAGNGEIVADSIHDIDDAFTGGHGTDGFTLDGVAVIHQHDIVVSGQAFLHRVKAGITPALINAAVHVTGEQDNQVLFQRRGSSFFRKRGAAAQEQAKSQQKSKQFFHSISSFG